MSIMLRRLSYLLTPQLEIYKGIRKFAAGKSVLEVGFGTGFGVLQYATQAKKVLAIEIEREWVAFARKCIPLENVSWEVGDICSGSLGMHDLIVMIEVLEHIPRWQDALRRCAEILLPDGTLIISTPNKNGSYLKNELHGDEWTASEFMNRLEMYFSSVKLYDFSLEREQNISTMITPLVAVCKK